MTLRAAPLIALLCASCSLLQDATPPEVRRFTIAPASAIAWRVEVSLSSERPLTIEYVSYPDSALVVESPAASEHSVLLTRLRPGRVYRYSIRGTEYHGVLTTPPLPTSLGRLRFDVQGAAASLVMLHLYDPNGFTGYVVVDSRGGVVWYYQTTDVPFGMTRRANGNFVFMDKGRGLLEVTPAGLVVNELLQDTLQRELHHDVLATDRNTVLFLAFERRLFEGRMLKGEAIWEWQPDRSEAVQRWSSWNQLDPAVDRGPRFTSEWLHANALARTGDGTTLLSLHYLDQVLAIAPDWSRTLWRLGGTNATIHARGNARFSGQHTPTMIAADRLLLFDNALDRAGPSRALELRISADSVVRTSEWAAPLGNFASAVGSARRHALDRTLVTFGMSAGLNGSSGPVEVFDVDDQGQPRWHLTIGGAYLLYRAEPIPAVGVERVR